MATYDGIIDPVAAWVDVQQLSTTALLKGGVGGPLNQQATELAARTKFLDAKIDALTAANIDNVPFGTITATNVQGALNDLSLLVGASTGTRTVEVKTATAGQSIFTLTNPYLPGSNTLQVFVNGLLFSLGTDYTETSSTVLTFATGLSLNDEVQFVVLGQNIGTAIASNVSFIPSGTGAVATNVQGKLREVVSVKDVGICDGVTDDSAKINARLVELAAAGGGALYVPPFTLSAIASTILVPAECSIYGEGKGMGGFIITSNVVGIRVTGADASLRGFGVTKNGTHTTNGIEVGDSTTGNGRAAILEDLSIIGMGQDGIRIRQGNLGTLRNIKATSNGRDGIHFGIETANTNGWTIDGTNDLQSNVRDGLSIEQGSSQNDANASRSHMILSVTAQTNGRHNIYCGTPGNLIAGYTEAGVTSDVYLDTYAYGNFVHLTQATIVTDVNAGTSFNVISYQNAGANKWRQFQGKTLFEGGVGKGIRLSNTDATTGAWDIEKTGSLAGAISLATSNGNADFRITSAGTGFVNFGVKGSVYGLTDNTYGLGTTSLRWSDVFTGKMQLSVPPVAAAAGVLSMGAQFSSSATAGGIHAVPATVSGYIMVYIGATLYKIPYFAA